MNESKQIHIANGTQPAAAPAGEAPCWSRIGIEGDNSCPELAKVIHCRNCHVFADAGRGLLDRPMAAEYRAEWSARLAAEAEHQKRAVNSVLIFSLQSEYLALPTVIFNEVTEMKEIRRIPGALSKLLMGLVNIRGELHLCFSMRTLLGLEVTEGERRSATVGGASKGRMLLMQRAGDAWVFPVDAVHGNYRYDADELKPPPITVEKAPKRFSRGTMEWKGKTVGRLDELAIFEELKGSMQ